MDDITIVGTKFARLGKWYKETVELIASNATQAIIKYREDDGLEGYGLVDKTRNFCWLTSPYIECIQDFFKS